MKAVSISVSQAVIAEVILDFIPAPNDDGGPKPWDPIAGEPHPIPWKIFELARRQVDRLINEVRMQQLHFSLQSDEKTVAKALVGLNKWVESEIDDWCGAKPISVKFPIPRPKGYDQLFRGALIVQAIADVREPSLQDSLQQGATKLFEVGFREINQG